MAAASSSSSSVSCSGVIAYEKISGTGRSADGTLTYQWKVNPKGARHFQAQIWTGKQYQTVFEQQTDATDQ